MRKPLCIISCIWSALVLKTINHIIILTLLWASGFPPCPYTCHTPFVSHPLMGTILIQKPKATIPHPQKHHLSTANPMMSVGRMMSSYPHTLGGNLLTRKIPHSALHGLHHPRTPMHDPRFTPLDLTLISPHWTPTPSKRLKNKQKGLKPPKKSLNSSPMG